MMRAAPILALVAVLTLAACSNPLSLLTGGGPNVAANVQAGKTNVQTLGTTTVNEQKLIRPEARSIEQSTGTTRVKAETTGNVSVNEKDAPWLIIAFAVTALLAGAGWIHGWLTPSPREKKLNRKIYDLEAELESGQVLL